MSGDEWILPRSAAPRTDELLAVLERSTWFVGLLEAVRDVDPPDWWIGAGVVRDLVWAQRFNGSDEFQPTDVDVAFFDARDLNEDRDRLIESELIRRRPDVAWDATNQAAVHVWYPGRFGVDVAPLASVPEAVATWPEYAVCVAARLSARGGIEICAPHGLDDLLDGVWQRNPARVTAREYERRLKRKQPTSRWPGVRVIDYR